MNPWLAFGLGLLLGGIGAGLLVAWRLRRGRAAVRMDVDAQRLEIARLQATIDELRAQRAEIDQAEHRFRDLFQAAGAEALDRNSQRFLTLAEESFKRWMQAAGAEVDQRRTAIEQAIGPIRELLDRQNAAVNELERHRAVAYRGLEEHVRSVASSHEKLSAETSRLVAALRRPEQRGRWGEMQLRRVVELAGMTKHCDFSEQVATDDPNTRDRPDMVVHLPGGGVIVIDAKVAISAYLDALQPDGDRDALLQRHAQQVQMHVKKLASKSYADQFARTPAFVVLFMPLESALAAALDIMPDLHDAAIRSNVIVATPTLLIALLRTIAAGWQEEDVAANARQIAESGNELYERLTVFVNHLAKVGSSIAGARDAYNRAVGSLEQRLLPSARRLRELHATRAPDVRTPARVEDPVRPITTIETEIKLPPAAGDGRTTESISAARST